VSQAEVAVQRQLLSETDGEANTFLLLNTQAIASSTRDLPISTFESELKVCVLLSLSLSLCLIVSSNQMVPVLLLV
jgi:hypothetical protein